MTWETVKQNGDEEQPVAKVELTKAELVTKMIGKITKELRKAHTKRYEPEEAEKTAALCLEAQKELTDFLSDSELISKERKLEVERIEAEKIFFYKTNKAEGEKATDTIIKAYVAKDPDVVQAKKDQYKSEADYNKYKNLLNVLKDGHLFFRGISKGKNDF